MRRALVAVGIALCAMWAQAADLTPPESRLEPLVESFHGTVVDDPYRWMEDTAAPDTMAWFEAQNRHTRQVLDALPGRKALRERLDELNGADVRVRELQWAGDRLFYMKRAPGEQTFKLYVRDGLLAAERLLVDPDAFKEGDQPAAIDYFRASPNGKRLAYGISLGGSENASLRVLDVGSGQAVGPVIPRARWAAPAWRFDSEALFYTQQKVPAPGAPPADLLRGSRSHVRTFGAEGTVRDNVLFGAGLSDDVTIAEDDTPVDRDVAGIAVRDRHRPARRAARGVALRRAPDRIARRRRRPGASSRVRNAASWASTCAANGSISSPTRTRRAIRSCAGR